MIFTSLKLHLDEYLTHQFDLETLSDPENSPFVVITQIKTKGNFSFQIYGTYISQPGKKIFHDTMTINNLSLANEMISSYLHQDPDQPIYPIKDIYGYCSGFVSSDADIILCAIVTNLEDSTWVCKTVLQEMEIFINNSKVS